jgi:hypothetical protein
MRKRSWSVDSMGGDVRIELLAFASGDGAANREWQHEIDVLLLRAAEPRVRRALEEVYDELHRGGPTAPRQGHWARGSSFERSLREDLRFAAFSGALKVERLDRVRIVPPPVESADDVLGPQSTSEPTLTWIAVALVDQDGAPVPNVRYSIKCSDGSVSEGSLDGKGKARVDGIPAGSCTVSFPDIDASEYQAA